MSGHSKWANIKNRKEAMDKKKGNVFSKMAKLIEIAARKGGDPEKNPTLRLTIEKARSFNMPNENVVRAIKKGSGENKEGGQLEEGLYEAYGPEGSQLIIETITDNKNRTLSDVRHILTEHGGRLAESGSVKWNFNQMGTIIVDKSKVASQSKEELELKMIDAGAEDIRWREDVLEIYAKPENLEKLKEAIKRQNIEIEESGLGWVPKNEIEIKEPQAKKQIETLFDELDENDDVKDIFSNIM
ncbi:MAG: YebC/PmpR family DNA-binding transcriptional regulator [bacterium]|nr:YebC/PmpR family DNA-binding transcriptional regulator [bacterium]